jgi:hypothetical protein
MSHSARAVGHAIRELAAENDENSGQAETFFWGGQARIFSRQAADGSPSRILNLEVD